jgi:hypothetical protein
MLSENRHAYIASIVFVGDFNPVIVQPFWLFSKGLIKEEEAENAKVDVIHPELVRYSLDWVSLQITRDRFELRTTQQAYFEPLKDLAASAFEVLRETPLRAVGINHLRHYTVSEKQYADLGNTLAPFSNWKDVLDKPTLLSVEMLQQNNDGTSLRIRVQPSDTLKAPYSFMININEHIRLRQAADQSSSAIQIVNSLKTKWRPSIVTADKIENALDKLIKR